MSASAETLTAERNPSITQRLAAEGFGAFLLVFAGIGTALYANYTSQGSGPLVIGLAFGLALLIAISVFGSISGGHLNPAVTFGHAIAGRIPWREVPGYVIAQTLGALAGAALLFIIASTNSVFTDEAYAGQAPRVADFFTNVSNQYGTNLLGDFSLAGVLLTEVVATAIFVGIFLAVTRRGFTSAVSAPVIIGFTFTVLFFVTYPVTYGGMNPARSTATAVFADGVLGDLWLFWVAPLAGGALAALLSIGLGVDRVLEPSDVDEVFDDVEAADISEVAEEVSGLSDEVAEFGAAVADAAADEVADAIVEEPTGEEVDIEEVEIEVVVEGDIASPGDAPEGAVLADHPDAGTTYAIKVAAGADAYHLPGSRYYEKTVATLYFIDEQAAKDAGYRKAGTRKK